MNRRKFIGAVAGVAGLSTAVLACPRCEQGAPVPHPKKPAEGPFSIEITSPPDEACRELPLFDTYKQAENFALARMSILRSNCALGKDLTGYKFVHEAGNIRVLTYDNQVAMEAAWGETWTMTTSYMDARGNIAPGGNFYSNV